MSVIWSGLTEEGAVVPVQVTAEGKVVAVGEGPVGDYLPITGGNLTGTLTIDTDKIKLELSGNIRAAANNIQLSKVTGSNSADQGVIYVQAGGTTNTDPCIAAYDGGGNRFTVQGDGATKIGGTLPSAPNIELKANGQIEAQGRILGREDFYSTNSTNRTTFVSDLTGNSFNPAHMYGYKGDGSLAFYIFNDGSSSFGGGNGGFTSDGELIFTSRGTRYKIVHSNGICAAEPYTREMELKEKAQDLITEKREPKPAPAGESSQVIVTPDNDNAS